MLLDEPFAGIDPIAVADIQKIVVHLKDRGIGVLVTDHNVRETLKITDRAYIVHDTSRAFRKYVTSYFGFLRRRNRMIVRTCRRQVSQST
jgi:ABC-type branched-subunit amino acid transport system ATPase component